VAVGEPDCSGGSAPAGEFGGIVCAAFGAAAVFAAGLFVFEVFAGLGEQLLKIMLPKTAAVNITPIKRIDFPFIFLSYQPSRKKLFYGFYM